MRSHRLDPVSIALYRERVTKGCYSCRNQRYKDDKGYCYMEYKYREKYGFPNATQNDCRFYLPKRNLKWTQRNS